MFTVQIREFNRFFKYLQKCIKKGVRKNKKNYYMKHLLQNITPNH